MKKDIVLIVEDYQPNLQVLGKNLERAGYDIVLSSTGKETFDLAVKSAPDLVLLDVMLPDMSGLAVCETLKKDPRTRDIPVIFLTAKTEPEDTLEGFRRGAVDYIFKPFNTPELLARVKTQIKLKKAQKELFDVNTQKDRFLSILTHDLKNALSGIVSLSKNLYELIEEGDPAVLKKDLSLIYKSSSELYSVLESLLDWARLQKGAFVFKPAPLDLREHARKIVLLYDSQAQAKKLRILNEVPPELFAYVDKNALHTILRNLVSNAIKFSHPEGTIRIDCDSVAGTLHLGIHDEGVGIKKEKLKNLFSQEGVSLPGTSEEVGTGVGLALCYDLTSKSGGHLSVESEEGSGATFTISLPEAGTTAPTLQRLSKY